MRYSFIVIAFTAVLGLAGGCSKSGSLVFVTVDAAAPIAGATRLHVALVDGNTNRASDLELSPASFPPAHSFAVDVAAGLAGTITVSVEAFDASSHSLGSASGAVAISAGHRVDLSLTLGGAPPDGGVADLTGGAADLTGAPPADLFGTSPPDMTYKSLTWVPKQLTNAGTNQVIWGSDASHIWIGGEDTATNQYSTGNDVWVQVSSNPFFQASGIWGTDSSHVYLVDTFGDIRAWDATTAMWAVTGATGGPTTVDSNVEPSLTGIWGASLNDVFVCGLSNSANATEYIYQNKTGNLSSGWVSVHSVLGGALSGISGTTGHVYAVGAAGRILQSGDDGVTWNTLTAPTPVVDLLGVFVLDSTHIYAVGKSGTILFSTGNAIFTKQPIPSNYAASTIYAVWAADPDNVFAVGSNGLVLHGDSLGNWVAQTSGLEVENADIFSVWGSSAHNVYVAAASQWVSHGQ
ncbi:MAG TPA: hypothetical protein VIA18_14210 [Polyangia bacterium]|nr:hypothetical protein [Polyangia bacterium]